MMKSAAALSGNGATMLSIRDRQKTAGQSIFMGETIKRIGTMAIFAWMAWYILTAGRTQGFWNTKMYTARQEFYLMTKSMVNCCSIIIWTL